MTSLAPHRLRLAPMVLASTLAFFAACAADDQETAGPSDLDGDGSGQSGDGDLSSGSGGSTSLPPVETELEESFVAPVVSANYLWSANPETNKIARIHASTLEIQVLEGGHSPTYLAALPSGKTNGGALVVNTRSNDASVFLEGSDGSIRAEHRVGIQKGASAWAVGQAGAFAIAWSRSSDRLLDSLDGYQDLTVLSISEDGVETTSLSVGFRPSSVVINDDESRAYVVSDPGISVIGLDGGVQTLREIFLPEELPGQSRDVVFTRDGSLALVRVTESNEILLVNTDNGDQKIVSLNGAVTDLDISKDGSTAVAVVRAEVAPDTGLGGQGGEMFAVPPPESTIALLPTATIFESPMNFETIRTAEIVGSAVVSQDASRVLLFTNAQPSTRLSILTTESGEIRVVDVKAPVQAAFIAQDGAHGVTLMTPALGSTKAGAFALVPLAAELSILPQFVTLSEEPKRALITTQALPGTPSSIHFGRLPELTVDTITLPSTPLSSGLVQSAGQAFVAQAHPEGRVTFIDLDSGDEKTVTGFELSSKVVE
jgi:hypothetical protein